MRRGLIECYKTTFNSMQALANLNIVREIAGKRHYRVFVCRDYLNILSEGMEGL